MSHGTKFEVGNRIYDNATHRYGRIEIMPTVGGSNGAQSTGRASVIGSGKVWSVTLADCDPA